MNNTAKQLVEQLGNNLEITIMADIVHGLDYEYEQLLRENEMLKEKNKIIDEIQNIVMNFYKYHNLLDWKQQDYIDTLNLIGKNLKRLEESKEAKKGWSCGRSERQ